MSPAWCSGRVVTTRPAWSGPHDPLCGEINSAATIFNFNYPGTWNPAIGAALSYFPPSNHLGARRFWQAALLSAFDACCSALRVIKSGRTSRIQVGEVSKAKRQRKHNPPLAPGGKPDSKAGYSPTQPASTEWHRSTHVSVCCGICTRWRDSTGSRLAPAKPAQDRPLPGDPLIMLGYCSA